MLICSIMGLVTCLYGPLGVTYDPIPDWWDRFWDSRFDRMLIQCNKNIELKTLLLSTMFQFFHHHFHPPTSHRQTNNAICKYHFLTIKSISYLFFKHPYFQWFTYLRVTLYSIVRIYKWKVREQNHEIKDNILVNNYY